MGIGMINRHLLFLIMVRMFHKNKAIRQEGIQAMPSSKKDEASSELQRNPLGRRLLVLHLAAAPALLGAARSAAAEPLQEVPAIPVATDADPSDGPGRGRGRPRGTGLNDSDPGDGPGNGRGARRGTGLTDADPGDGPGNGRGARRGTGLTDADPGDGQGNGRGTQRKAMTDSDPRDEAGRGRRGT
jgi:hypothetical protein